jgi:hypothetical protein
MGLKKVVFQGNNIVKNACSEALYLTALIAFGDDPKC